MLQLVLNKVNCEICSYYKTLQNYMCFEHHIGSPHSGDNSDWGFQSDYITDGSTQNAILPSVFFFFMLYNKFLLSGAMMATIRSETYNYSPYYAFFICVIWKHQPVLKR